jgi:diguanylate cyclase (GGDEF)-like protein/PAS domain S-box-containing protein
MTILTSNDLFINAFNLSAIGMAIVSMEGTFIKVNSSFCKIIQYSPTELEQMNFQDITHPDDLERNLNNLNRMLNEETAYCEMEKRYIKKNGSNVWVLLNMSLVKDETKKPLYYISQIQDISEKKVLQEELKKSEERYRALVESSPNGIVVHQEGKIVYTNPKFKSFIKAPSEKSLIGQHIIHFVHPDFHEAVKERINTLEKNKSVGALEEKYIRFDGTIVDVEVIATPIEYMDKPAFQVIISDISNRKKMESELNKSQDELKASEERFRLLAEYSSDMITMHDIKRTYLYASPASKEILQYEEDELVGKDAYLFIHPEDIEKVNAGHQTALNTGYSVFSYRIRRKDGEYVWIESAVKFMNEIRFGEQKLIVVSRNISERKLVEQRLQEANELLQHLSTIDGLTGVSNRRTFDERLEMEWKRGLRNSTPLSLLMLDIDYFKAYNDTYGHQGGDGCLKQIASVIQKTLGRSTDLLCRYGGEEFCVILPETDETGAKIVGEKIRASIMALKIPHSGSKILPWVTISIGAATMIPSIYTSYINLVSNADKAVYKAKFDGRNCVRSYE